MIASIDPRETSSIANVFNGKSKTGSTSGNSPFEELFSNYFASQTNASTADTQKSALVSWHSSTNKSLKDGRANSPLSTTPAHSFNIHSRDKFVQKNVDERKVAKESKDDSLQNEPKGSARNSVSGNNSNEYMLKKSFKIVRELDSKGDESVSSELSTLREDKTVGSFWQSIDDETASEMIDALKEMSPDELAATLSLVRITVSSTQEVITEEEEPGDEIEAIKALSDEDKSNMEMEEEGEEPTDDEIGEGSSSEETPTSTAAQTLDTKVVSEEKPAESLPVEAAPEVVPPVGVASVDSTVKANVSEMETAKTTTRDTTGNSTEKARPDNPAENAEKMLAALREDPATSGFWKNVDDRIARKLLSAVARLETANTESTKSSETAPATTPELSGATLAGTVSLGQSVPIETASNIRHSSKKPDGESEGETASTALPEGSEKHEAALKPQINSGESRSLRQEYRDERASEAVSTNPTTGSGSGTSGSTGSITASSASPAAVPGEEVDLSDLLKSFQSRGETAKTEGHQTSNTVSGQAIKRVSMSGQETSREFSFTQDQSPTAAAVRSEAAQSKGSDPVKSTLFSQIVERAEFFKGPQQLKVMTLQLKPEALGKLEMQLATKDGVVTARISAENAVVKEKLEQLVPQIREHLEQQGVNILQISVDISRRESDGSERGMSEGDRRSGLRIGAGRASRNKASDQADSGGSLLINPEIRRMALNIKAVDVTV